MNCLRASAPLDAEIPSSERLLRGRVLGGRYVVEQLIGTGAMGRVYRAWHVGLGRACAVKIIREDTAVHGHTGDEARWRADTAPSSRARRSGWSLHAGHRRRRSSRTGERAPSSEGARPNAPAASTSDAVLRFQVEARAASRLDHPNIVRVLDFGCEPAEARGDGAGTTERGGAEAQAPSLWYLVTEHLEGTDLIDVLNAEPILPAARIVSIMRQLCSALQHAHDAGVIHRDIKPENIRLVSRPGDDGEPVEQLKLLDFGTAKLLHDDLPGAFAWATSLAALDDDGGRTVVGTPAYMSPEQAAGQRVDARSDIYACGVLLFEMATGRLPFERPTPIALAAAHVECPPPRPSAFNEAIDPELEALILRCLRKNPDDRPESARALREALDRLAQRPGRGPGMGLAAEGRWSPPASAAPAPLSRGAQPEEDFLRERAIDTSTWVGHRLSAQSASALFASTDRPPPSAGRLASSVRTWIGHRAPPCPPATLVPVSPPSTSVPLGASRPPSLPGSDAASSTPTSPADSVALVDSPAPAGSTPADSVALADSTPADSIAPAGSPAPTGSTPADSLALAGSTPADSLALAGSTPADSVALAGSTPADSLALAGSTPADSPAPASSLAPASSRGATEPDPGPPFPLVRPRRTEEAWSQRGQPGRRSRLGPAVLGTLVATLVGGSLCLLCGAAGALLGQSTPPQGAVGERSEAGPRAMHAPTPTNAQPAERR